MSGKKEIKGKDVMASRCGKGESSLWIKGRTQPG